MAGHASQPQWYLARDGKQHGPISEAELTQFIEQGHLQPNDLVWREGFADWRPAMLVFSPRGNNPPAAHPAPSRRPMARQPDMDLAGGAPGSAAGRSYAPEYGDDGAGSRFRPARVVLVLLLLAVLGGGAALVYLYPDRVSRLVASFTAPSGTMVIADTKSLEVPPLAGFGGATAEGIDSNLQATALWRVVKREFPEWYKERVDEAAALARDKQDDAAIGKHMGTKLRELRREREQARAGLQATQQRLKAVAVAFFDNLVQLRAHSPEACHALIVGGEANPTIVALLQGTKYTAGLQAQLTAMFEAIAEGRKQARVHIRPSTADFQQLADDLKRMGWTQEDMVLFNELRKAPPEKMCQLLHDFFKAQLEVQDPEVQMKLIISALGPVFAD